MIDALAADRARIADFDAQIQDLKRGPVKLHQRMARKLSFFRAKI
jgi:hypothetical protein